MKIRNRQVIYSSFDTTNINSGIFKKISLANLFVSPKFLYSKSNFLKKYRINIFCHLTKVVDLNF